MARADGAGGPRTRACPARRASSGRGRVSLDPRPGDCPRRLELREQVGVRAPTPAAAGADRAGPAGAGAARWSLAAHHARDPILARDVAGRSGVGLAWLGTARF